MSIALTKQLLTCEHPFRWQPRNYLEVIPDDMIGRLSDQIREKEFENELEFLMLFIGLSYEFAIENRIEEALEQLETAENKLKLSMNDPYTDTKYLALLHIIMSMKIFLLAQEDLNVTTEMISEVPQISTMDLDNQAALHGLRATFIGQYGINGSKLAIELSSKAIEMNPNEPLWHFLKGKYLGRIRRVERPFDIPSVEEISSLERAIEVKNASYMVFTAQLYRETANRMFQFLKKNQSVYPNFKLKIDALNEKSLALYEKSIQLKPNCSHLLLRAAKGFLLLPIPYRNEKRAKELLDKGLKIAPDSGYGNHVMAQYYERIKKDPQTSIKYLKICEKKKIFGAAMDLLRLEYQQDRTLNVVQKLENLLKEYSEKSRHCQIYSQLTSYHLFVLNDLSKSCKYALEVMHLDIKCDDMIQHRPMCLITFEKINMYDVLIDEIKVQRQDSQCSVEDGEYYAQFLDKLLWAGIPISRTKPLYLKKEIMTNSSRMFKKPSSKSCIKTSSNYTQRKNRNVFQSIRSMSKVEPMPHKTDVDRNMNELLVKFKEDLKIEKENTNEYDRVKSSTSTNTVPLEENNVTSKNHNSEDDDSEDDDDMSFRLSIYQKSLEKTMKDVKSSDESTNDFTRSQFSKRKGSVGVSDVAKSFKKITIQNDKSLKELSQCEYSKN